MGFDYQRKADGSMPVSHSADERLCDRAVKRRSIPTSPPIKKAYPRGGLFLCDSYNPFSAIKKGCLFKQPFILLFDNITFHHQNRHHIHHLMYHRQNRLHNRHHLLPAYHFLLLTFYPPTSFVRQSQIFSAVRDVF